MIEGNRERLLNESINRPIKVSFYFHRSRQILSKISTLLHIPMV